jgi:hypothetical protein
MCVIFRELLAEDKIWGGKGLARVTRGICTDAHAVFGIHPHNAKYYTASIEERIVECLKVSAINRTVAA